MLLGSGLQNTCSKSLVRLKTQSKLSLSWMRPCYRMVHPHELLSVVSVAPGYSSNNVAVLIIKLRENHVRFAAS